jgi:hypothetical protein
MVIVAALVLGSLLLITVIIAALIIQDGLGYISQSIKDLTSAVYRNARVHENQLTISSRMADVTERVLTLQISAMEKD